MHDLAKGPIPAFIFYLLLLAAAYAGLGDGSNPTVAFASDTGPFVVAAVVANAVSAFPPLNVALLIAAAAGALWFGVALAWTGNRIVSFLAGALWCLHPAFRETMTGGGDALLALLPAMFVTGALLIRENAWAARREAGHARVLQGMSVLAAMMAVFSGPTGMIVAVVIPVTDAFFHHGQGGSEWRDKSKIAQVTLGGFAVVVAFNSGFSRSHDLELAQAAALSVGVPPLDPLSTLTALGLLVGGGAAFALALRGLKGSPRWLVVYGATGWVLFVTAFGADSLIGGGGLLLASMGWTLVAPALAWRALVAMSPEPLPAHAPPPTLDPHLMHAGLPPAPTIPENAVTAGDPTASHGTAMQDFERVPFPSVPEVRAAVEAAVSAAVAASGSTDESATPSGVAAPGRRYAQEWDQYADEWDAKEGARGAKILGEEWTDQNLDRNLFSNYCLPYLAPHHRVLEIGQGGGKFTRLIAPEVAHVICLDVARSMLERARQDVGIHRNVSYVLGDGRGLAPLTTASIDFIFSYDVFVHLDQEDMYLYLEDMRRVLRPGGRAVVSFANLLDPLGFKQFQYEVGRHRTGRRAPGRINFLSPDLVRTMVTSANLSVDSIHLAANNRDMLVVIERPPA